MILPYSESVLAEQIADALDNAVMTRGYATFAIPGGRSPGPILSLLAASLEPYVCERITLLWVDERAVPRGHEDRNDCATLAAWEEGGPLPGCVAPMPAEAEDLEAAAAAYAQTVAEATKGEPIDVCLIGIGEDGHLASLFPEHEGLKELDPVFAIYDSPKLPPRRLSLSLGIISQARLRLIVARGGEKGAVAARVQQHGPQPKLPVSLLPVSDTYWFLDEAAAQVASV